MRLTKRLCTLAALLSLQPLAAQQSVISYTPSPESPVRIEAVAMFSQAPRAGYLPVKVTISNKGKSGGKVSLNCTSESAGYRSDESSLRSDFSFDAEPEKTLVQEILIPVYNPESFGGGPSYNRSEVRIKMSSSFGSMDGSIAVDANSEDPSILLSEPLFTENASSLDGELSKIASSGSGGRSSEQFASKFDAKILPEDWRGLIGIDSIAMTDGDWSAASTGAHNALMQWTRMGGRLVIYNQGSSDLRSLGIKTDDSAGSRSLGSVELVQLGDTLKLDATETVNRFYATGHRKAAALKSYHKSLNNDFERSWPLQTKFGEADFHYLIFVIVLIAFAVLVGPINLFVFAKSGRRHRLFITTPLISLGASIVLMLLIFFQDGLGGRGMRVVLMEVRPDNGENAAYIQQEQISRTGVLLGGKFEMDGQAMIAPVRLATSKWARFTNSSERPWRFEVQAADGKQQISGDWFQSRSEQGQLVQAVIPTRGRIESRSEAGAPTFVSTFDFPIQRLWFRDAGGALWQASGITPGKSFVCTAAGPLDESAMTDELARLSEKTRSQASDMFKRKECFVAISENAPGIETFQSISWKETHTILTGPVMKP